MSAQPVVTFLQGDAIRAAIGGLQAVTLRFDNVPDAGAGPAMNDLVSGAVSRFFAPLGPAIPLVRDGRLRAYCVTSATHQRMLPEAPTLVEGGFPDMVYEGWTGIWGPRGLPAAPAWPISA